MTQLQKLKYLAARYRLALADTDAMVRIAFELLAAGNNTKAIVELVALQLPLREDVEPLFRKMCHELSVEIPGKDESISLILRHHIESIASGSRPLLEVLEDIMQEVYFAHESKDAHNVGDSRDLQYLIASYWGYDELTGRPDEVPYKGKYGTEAVSLLDEDVRQQAREWLERNG